MLEFLSNLKGDNVLLTIVLALLGLLYSKYQSLKKLGSDLSFEKTKNKLQDIQHQLELNKKNQELNNLTQSKISVKIQEQKDEKITDDQVTQFFNNHKPDNQ